MTAMDSTMIAPMEQVDSPAVRMIRSVRPCERATTEDMLRPE